MALVKKAQNGTKTWFQMSPTERKNKQTEIKTTRGREGLSKYMDSVVNANFEANAARRGKTTTQLRNANKKPDVDRYSGKACKMGNETEGCAGSEKASERRVEKEKKLKSGGNIKKRK